MDLRESQAFRFSRQKASPDVRSVESSFTALTFILWKGNTIKGVLAIDEGVGKLIKALKETGQYENTLIVFGADQGIP